jgi:3-deoxy-D-manno-octulosonic-acid transferase
MYFVYRLLLTLGFLVLLPRFILDAFRHGKYVAGFGERMGNLAPLETNEPVVWIHCVSVGETQAARPLVNGIRRRFPNHTIVISTTTLTGQTLARQIFKADAAKVFYFPFDWTWTVRRSLDVIQPSLVLIMETEIWPGFLRECKSRGIPVAIVNGRLSPQSFGRYLWIKGFIKRVLESLSLAVMQTEADAKRIGDLGMDPERVLVSGSIKFDAGTMTIANSVSTELSQRFSFSAAVPLLIAASTHAPEESIVLEAFRKTLLSKPRPRLLIAPRHPERFDDVAALLDRSDLTWTRRTAVPSEADKTCDIVLLDTIGELGPVYSLGTIVFVGGSIAPTGGHNILEPAAVSSAIVTGPHVYNFKDINQIFLEQDAIIQLRVEDGIDTADELASVFTRLLTDDHERLELQRRAKQVWEQNLGATELTLDYLEPILNTRKRPTRSSQE